MVLARAALLALAATWLAAIALAAPEGEEPTIPEPSAAPDAAAVPDAAAKVEGAWKTHEFTVFGYLPEYRLGGFNYEAAFQSGLTHLIFFSLEISEAGLPAALDRLPSKADIKKARAAADKVGGKILLSFGGNARSQNFGRVATNPKYRAKFVEAVNRLLTKLQFDGVDLNWEYPRDHTEWRAWGVLMKDLKQGLLGGPSNNVVTSTMYLDENHYETIRRYNLLADADYVHCMAYDQPRQHSTFAFFKRGIKLARDKQFPLKKFTIGVPFYARHTTTGEPKTYAEVMPHLHNAIDDQWEHYYFNSRTLIEKKTKAAFHDGVGGVMIWELGQDVQPLSDPRSLMTALHGGLPWYVKPEGARPVDPLPGDDIPTYDDL